MSKQVEKHLIFLFCSGLGKRNVFVNSPVKAEILLCILDYHKTPCTYQRSLGSSRIRQQLKTAFQNTTSLSYMPKFCLNPMPELPLLSTCTALKDIAKHGS